jgi:hypothetical protein
MADKPSILSQTLGLILQAAKSEGKNPIEALASEFDRQHCLATAVEHDETFTCWHLVLDPPILVGVLQQKRGAPIVGACVASKGVTPRAIAEFRDTLEHCQPPRK